MDIKFVKTAFVKTAMVGMLMFCHPSAYAETALKFNCSTAGFESYITLLPQSGTGYITITLRDNKQDVTALTPTPTPTNDNFWANEKFHLSFNAGRDPTLRVSGDALKCPYMGYEDIKTPNLNEKANK